MSDSSTANHDSGADAKSAVGACPARHGELFLVPARYALAEYAAEHSCCSPAANSQSHPQALRRLRKGYLYLWHQQGQLRRFVIATDGLLLEQGLDDESRELDTGAIAGVALDKHSDAWLLYSEIPLPKTAYQGLVDSPAERLARMRCIPLPEIARRLEAQHCPVLSEAEKVVAELMPTVRDQFAAHDYAQNGEAYREGVDALGQQMMGEPSPERVNAYIHARTWLSEREQAAARHPQAAEHAPGEWSSVAWDLPVSDAWLSKARSQAGGLHAVFAALDDDLGILRDLNFEQGWVNQREEDWDQENAHKGMIAGFINSLITEDGAELSNLINYRYRDRDIQLTAEQGDVMLQARRELQPLLAEETEVNQRQRHKIGHAAADARIADIIRREQIVLAPTREFVPADLHGLLQGVVMSYHADKVHNMTDAKSSAQVTERVDLPRMQRWITDVAEPHRHWLIARREALYADLATYLPRHGAALWYVDYDSGAHCAMLGELSLNTLGALCSSGPGVELAVNLLRSPSVDQPFSLLSGGFTPSLMDLGDRAAQAQVALTSANQAAIGELVGSLVESREKLAWLSALGGEDGKDWSQAVSRLASAFAALEVEHLSTSQTPNNLIQRFPVPLQALLILMRLSTDSVINASRYSFTLSGSAGQRVWEFGRAAGQSLRRGITPAVHAIKDMNTLGGVLPLAALLLHLNNLHEINQRDQGRAHDEVRQREHLAENFKVGAALSAVIGAAWEATGRVEVRVDTRISNISLKAPIITLFGLVTGGLAAVAAAADLGKLFAEAQKEGAYWTADHWARLGHDSALFGLMAAQAGLGGNATYMALAGKWSTEQAIKWFTLRIMPINWLLLVIEGLYLAWNYHRDTELQAFLEQCCWGKAKRWGESPEQRSQEMQTLIDLLFKPKLRATAYLTSRQIGGGGNSIALESRTESLSLYLPGANPQGSQLYVKVVGFDAANRPLDYTSEWLGGLKSTWLPIQQGMGLRLSGKLPRRVDTVYWQIQVLYHSPLAMQAGTLNSRRLLVGGRSGMRYIVRGNSVVEHDTTEGRLLSDAIGALPVNANLLQPKEPE